MWNLKNDINELIYKTEIDSQTTNKLMVTGGIAGGGGREIRSLGLTYTHYYV